MVSLTNTNRWRNLKKKAKNIKDIKQQETVNESLMTTLEVLDANIEKLVKMHNQTTDILNKVNDFVNSDYQMMSGVVIPVLRALDKHPELKEVLKKELGEEKYAYIYGKEDKPDESGV